MKKILGNRWVDGQVQLKYNEELYPNIEQPRQLKKKKTVVLRPHLKNCG